MNEDYVLSLGIQLFIDQWLGSEVTDGGIFCAPEELHASLGQSSDDKALREYPWNSLQWTW